MKSKNYWTRISADKTRIMKSTMQDARLKDFRFMIED